MTPAEFRALADAATPGRWINGSTKAGYRSIFADCVPTGTPRPLVTQLRGQNRKSDARLIALAPDLARLCAELGEALREIREQCRQGHGDDLIAETTDLALAKLAELKMP